MEWHWLLLDELGAEVSAPSLVPDGQRFASQSDAETWLGELWPALRDSGVASVALQQGDRPVYGPMSLHPGN